MSAFSALRAADLIQDVTCDDRDMTIEELAVPATELLQRGPYLEADCNAYRMLIQEAIDRLARRDAMKTILVDWEYHGA